MLQKILILLLVFFVQSPAHGQVLESMVQSGRVTLIHTISPKSAHPWMDKFLSEYQKNGTPPADWFRFGIWGGLMVVSTDRQDLKQLTYHGALRESFHAEGMNHEQIESIDDRIVFLANPKREAIWLSGIGDDPVYKGVNRLWWANPLNWVRPNRFRGDFLKSVRGDWRMPFRHSGIYDDYGIVGHVARPMGKGGTPMHTGVVTNGAMLESSKLIIPAKLSPTGAELVIYSDGCEKRLNSVRAE